MPPEGSAVHPAVRWVTIGALVVIVALGGFQLFREFGRSPGEPPASASPQGSASASVEPSASTEPTTSAEPTEVTTPWPNLGWNTVARPDAEFVTYLQAADSWAALGARGAWVSTDGTEWAPTAIEAPVATELPSMWGPLQMVDVKAVGDRLIAVATWYGPNDAVTGVAWQSADQGQSWTLLTDQLGYIVTGAASDGQRMVVSNHNYGIGAGSVLWTDDGATWNQRLAEGAEASMTDVTWGPNGFTAVGYRWSDTTGEVPRIWHSPDGDIWTQGTHMAAPPASIPFAVTTTQSRAILVATSSTPWPLEPGNSTRTVNIWVSPDGEVWSQASVPAANVLLDFLVEESLMGAYLDGTPLIVLNTDAGVRIWVSQPEGLAWQELHGPFEDSSATVSSVASDGQTLLLFGLLGGDPVAWIGTPVP